MSRVGSLLVLSASCLFATPIVAADLIDPVSQDRHVSVSALAVDNTIPETDQDADSSAAPDFGPFLFTVVANATVTNASASSSASQTSEIFSDSLRAVGSMSASGESSNYEAFGQASGTSHCEVTFDVTGPCIFTLSGEIAAFGNGSASVSLDGPTGTIVSVSAGTDQVTPVLEGGVLDPVTYTLACTADGFAVGDFFISFTADASYDLLLELEPQTSVSRGDGVVLSTPAATPNPFRDVILISHGFPSEAPVGISIFDVRGRLVRELTASQGERALSWDARNGFGETVSPGIYFVRLAGGGEVQRLKVTRIR